MFVYSLFIVALIVCGICVRSLFCYALLSVMSSFAIISLSRRELVAWLKLSMCDCGIFW